MKNLWIFFVFLIFVSCGEAVDAPRNLVSKSDMSELIAELAINDQLSSLSQSPDLEGQTRYLFQKKGVSAKDFSESYTYYIAMGSMDKILKNAQQIILEKDPNAKAYVEKKNKEEPSHH